MVSISDSTATATLIDVAEYDERGLIERLVEIIRERDPDILENHNIFGFDLNFLVRRARALGVNLALGRDGSAPSSYQDVVKVGEKTDSFTRWVIAGREVVDTLHAVRRYGAIVRDMRHQGLKEAARYFGVAKEDREYVPGPEIWATFQRDPERVRRYALDDVLEVDELSQLLHATPFALAQMVPKPYERIATSGTGQGLIEPLLVRAYLMHGKSLPGGHLARRHLRRRPDRPVHQRRGAARRQGGRGLAVPQPDADLQDRPALRPPGRVPDAAARADHAAARAQGRGPPPSARQPRGARPRGGLRRDEAVDQLVLRQPGHQLRAVRRPGRGRRGHPRVAARCSSQMLLELEQRGVLLVEADTDGVLFGVPESWTEDDERRLIEEIGASLPDGISVEHDGRYAAMYSYAEKNYILQRYDGQVRLVGGSFRSSRSERYGEQFLRTAAPLLLAGRFEELRALFLELVARLRAHEVPIEELCAVGDPLQEPGRLRARAGGGRSSTRCCSQLGPRALEGRRPRDVLPGAGRS